MIIVVVPEAADEFDSSAARYDEKEPGLGQRFRDEVDHYIRWIAANSDVPRLRPAGYRRVNLQVFPHYIAYVRLDDTIWILAIGHGHREPEYWIGRKRNIE